MLDFSVKTSARAWFREEEEWARAQIRGDFAATLMFIIFSMVDELLKSLMAEERDEKNKVFNLESGAL